MARETSDRTNKDRTEEGLGSEALLVRPREAAAMLAISPRKLWELTNLREVPSVRIGRCLRYPREGLEGWVVARQVRGS